MIKEDAILEQTLYLLGRDHGNTGKKDGLFEFNRLLTKSILGRAPLLEELLNFSKDEIVSFQYQWPTARLAEIKSNQEMSHDRFVPRTECGINSPVIIAEYRGVLRLLDGSNRINMWVLHGDITLHDVNLHQILRA